MSAITILTYAAQAETGTGAAVDVSAFSTLRLDLRVETNTYKESEIDIVVEDAPSATGPWRQVAERKYLVGGFPSGPYGVNPARTRFLLSGFDKFARIRWDGSNRIQKHVPLNLSLGLTGDGQPDA